MKPLLRITYLGNLEMKFISGLESQEQAGFDRLHSLLSRLPVPSPVSTNGSKMSHTEALEGGFLPNEVWL